MMFPLNPLCIRLSLDRLCEYLYFDGYPNLNIALINGTIDAFLGDEPALKSIHAEQPQIDYIKERLTNNKYSFAFRKDDEKEKKLCDQLNSFLAKANSDGTIAEIDSIWFGTDDSKKVVDMSDLTGENGTIHVITTTTNEIFNSPKKRENEGVYKGLRQLPLTIESADFDYIAYSSQLEMFGKENSLNDKTIRNLLLVFEEAVKQNISARKDVFPIRVMTEFSETEDSVTLEAVYKGESYDPAQNGDEISLRLVKNVTTDREHTYSDGENRFICKIKSTVKDPVRK